MDNNQSLLSTDLQIDNVAHNHLKETANWARLLSILGLTSSIILAIAGFFVGTFLSSVNRTPYSSYNYVRATGTAITILYLFIAIVAFITFFYLFRFATKMKMALQSGDQNTLNASLQNLKIHYRIVGVIAIIYLFFLVLGLIGIAFSKATI